jgi:ATP-dependent RNA helicase RhlE
LSHVLNFELPNVPETYVHRIGRTGRAGASGIALSFCCREERSYLRDIERLIKKSVPVKNWNGNTTMVHQTLDRKTSSNNQSRISPGKKLVIQKREMAIG